MLITHRFQPNKSNHGQDGYDYQEAEPDIGRDEGATASVTVVIELVTDPVPPGMGVAMLSEVCHESRSPIATGC